MKLLYLTFQEDAPLYSGVTRKIAWQAGAFERLGFEVTYSLWSGSEYRFCTGGRTEPIPVPEGPGRMHRFAQAAGEYLERHPCDVLYFRLDRMSFDAVALCRAAKAGGAQKVILEIPNYPYFKDYIRNVRGVRPITRQAVTLAKILGTAAEDRFSGLSLRGAADAAVLIGDRAERFFGIPAVNISNGVAVSEFDEIRHPQNEGEIVLIGVAGTLWWQAYDRVLAGMAAYRKRHPEGPKLRFLLVGGDAKEMPVPPAGVAVRPGGQRRMPRFPDGKSARGILRAGRPRGFLSGVLPPGADPLFFPESAGILRGGHSVSVRL